MIIALPARYATSTGWGRFSAPLSHHDDERLALDAETDALDAYKAEQRMIRAELDT